MNFVSRVDVQSASGRRVYTTHAAEAIRLVQGGSATRISRKRIALVEHGTECGRTNTGQTYTWQETVVGGMPPICQHKPIYPEDLHLFRLAIIENLVH